MRKFTLLILLVVALAHGYPGCAFAWTLPVPSGMAVGDEVYASRTGELSNRGLVTVTPDNNAVMRSSMAGVSTLLNSSSSTADTLKLSETGAVANQKVVICNLSTTAFTIPDETNVFVGGGSSVSQYDCISIVYTGSVWLQIAPVSAN